MDNKTENNNIKIGFFGTPEYAVMTLEALHKAGLSITFIVTQPDRPKGRGLELTASPAKVWGIKHGIDVLQPEDLKDNEITEKLKSYNCDVFIVIAYGKIIPESILNIPAHKSLNIHGSLLPYLRGASPIESAILSDIKNTGVTIIRMDSAMDHGPIVAQREVMIDKWPPRADELGKKIVETGSELMVDILPKWINSDLVEIEQDHSKATFTKLIKKEDALINLDDDAYKNFLKIQAYSTWPEAYFIDDGKRIKIKQAFFRNNELTIERVIPEGKKEITWSGRNGL